MLGTVIALGVINAQSAAGASATPANPLRCIDACADFTKYAQSTDACKAQIQSPACLNAVCTTSDTFDACWGCLGIPANMIASAKMFCANGGGDLLDQLKTGGEGNGTAPSASASAAAGVSALSSALVDASGLGAGSAGASATPTGSGPETSATSASGLGLGASDLRGGNCGSECDDVIRVLGDPVCEDRKGKECLDKLCAANNLEKCYRCVGADDAKIDNLRQKCAAPRGSAVGPSAGTTSKATPTGAAGTAGGAGATGVQCLKECNDAFVRIRHSASCLSNPKSVQCLMDVCPAANTFDTCYGCLGESLATIDVLKSTCAELLNSGGLSSTGILSGSSLGSLATGLPGIAPARAADGSRTGAAGTEASDAAAPSPAPAAGSNAGRKLPPAVGALSALSACALVVVLF